MMMPMKSKTQMRKKKGEDGYVQGRRKKERNGSWEKKEERRKRKEEKEKGKVGKK